jgi:NAD+ kinase
MMASIAPLDRRATATTRTIRQMPQHIEPPHRSSPPIRRIGLLLRPDRDLTLMADHVLGWAAGAGINVMGISGERRLPASVERLEATELPAACDVVLALGGDGTMLGALRLAAPAGVPVLGVNLGTLGYLTELDAEHLDRGLAALQSGGYRLEARTAVALNPVRGTRVTTRIAYNDVVLSRVPGRGQAKLGLSVDGELLARYSSDGIIVATPQGSTAYSFAAGGPLVSPRAQGLVLTPDAPHGLFNRSVVLAEHERLEVEVLASSAPVSLEVDGQLLDTLDPGAMLELLAVLNAAKVLRVQPGGFADRARRKLGIADPANLADYDPAGHTR